MLTGEAQEVWRKTADKIITLSRLYIAGTEGDELLYSQTVYLYLQQKDRHRWLRG